MDTRIVELYFDVRALSVKATKETSRVSCVNTYGVF